MSHSTLFFGAAVAVAVVATPLRRELAKPWIWLGAAVALAIFLPNLIWQWQHGFPTLEDLRNVRLTGKNVELAPLQFITQQVLMMHPATLPVWLATPGAITAPLFLPPPICGHQTHSMWGPGDFAGDSLIWLPWSAAGIAEDCESVEVVGEHHHPWGMAEENRPIHLCRGLSQPLSVLWPELVHWN